MSDFAGEISEVETHKRRLSAKEIQGRYEQQTLQVDPCPMCNATDKKQCEYDRSLKRLGLLPAGERPRKCLAGGPTGLPEGY